MLRVFVTKGECLSETAAEGGEVPPEALWVDILDPRPDDLQPFESAFGFLAPTREEMQEIEASSRLYHENGAMFMTATLVSGSDTGNPESHAVTFILAAGRLVTLRYSSPRPFQTFPQRAMRQPGSWGSGETIMAGLLEAVIDRTADILEAVSAHVDDVSRDVFGARKGDAPLDAGDFQTVLVRLGRENDLAGRLRESLVSINRVLTFLAQAADGKLSKDIRGHVKTMTRDISSLTDHTAYLANKIQFLLDATLGLISIEQNKVIKILAIVGTVLGPPTLFASMWGMNFHNMPELAWPGGYAFALGVIAISGLVPFFYFKFRKWL